MTADSSCLLTASLVGPSSLLRSPGGDSQCVSLSPNHKR